jgi:hypothetical protein
MINVLIKATWRDIKTFIDQLSAKASGYNSPVRCPIKTNCGLNFVLIFIECRGDGNNSECHHVFRSTVSFLSSRVLQWIRSSSREI